MARSSSNLQKQARQTLRHAYAPYSGFHVAAAVQSASGKIFSGCNVECASYGGTVCAERVAIWNAVAAGERKLKSLLVISEGPKPWTPCGFCRQVMAEFMEPDSEIICQNTKGKTQKYRLADLLPFAFTPKDLKR